MVEEDQASRIHLLFIFPYTTRVNVKFLTRISYFISLRFLLAEMEKIHILSTEFPCNTEIEPSFLLPLFLFLPLSLPPIQNFYYLELKKKILSQERKIEILINNCWKFGISEYYANSETSLMEKQLTLLQKYYCINVNAVNAELWSFSE